MTEPQQPQFDGPDPPAHQALHRLGYAAPDPNAPAGGMAPIGQLALGLAAFVAWGIVAGLLTAAAIAVGIPQVFGLAAGAFSVLLLVGLTITAHRRWHWRSFLAGVLIIPGLVLLALGFCAVGLR